MADATARVGILGGSGLYAMDGLEQAREVRLETPFGEPSDAYRVGVLEGVPVAFLARHGRGHRLLPTEINYRANVFGFKRLGVERVLSASAVGSLREEIHPRGLVLPRQFIDRTRHRTDTFFGRGLAAHVSLADPVCPDLHRRLVGAASVAAPGAHEDGTYLCMEGPQFSTRAESHLYRSWGATIIGMTNLQEARLCREAELCYAVLALVTDYDCWRDGEEEVVVDELLENLRHGALAAQDVFRELLRAMPAERPCDCSTALARALITDPRVIPADVLEDLRPLVGRYLDPEGESGGRG